MKSQTLKDCTLLTEHRSKTMSVEGMINRGLRFSKMTDPHTGELIDACKNNPRIMEAIKCYKDYSKNSKPVEKLVNPEPKKEVKDKGKEVK